MGGCQLSRDEKRKRTLRRSLRVSGQRSRGNQRTFKKDVANSVKCYREWKKETFKQPMLSNILYVPHAVSRSINTAVKTINRQTFDSHGTCIPNTLRGDRKQVVYDMIEIISTKKKKEGA